MTQTGPFTIKTLSLEEINRALRLIQMGSSTGVTAATPTSIQTGVTSPAASASSSTTIPVASFLTVTGEAALSASRKLVVQPTLSLTDGGPLSSLTVGTAAFSGDVATPVNSFVTTIQPNVVSNSKLAKMPPLTIKGNNTGLTADPLDLTTAQTTAMLDVFVASGAGHLKGLVPDPGASSGTTKFLREDASWQTAVTSVGLALPTELTVSGSPVTTTGTLTAVWASEASNTFFAAPQGSPGTPAFRTITVTGDLSGTLPSPTVYQAHLTDQAAPAAPASGTLILASFNQQGFSVAHVYDTQGNAIEITRDNLAVVRNISGSTITKGQAVYITGSTGTVPTVALAKSDSASTMPALGVMYDTTVSPGYGRVMLLGNIENFNLSAFANGNALFVSATTAGGFTATEPSAPNIPQFMGTVLNNGVGNGVMFVNPGEGEDESPVGTTLTSAHIWVGNASNVAADVAMSGNGALSNTGAFTLVSIPNDTAMLGDLLATAIAAPATPSAGLGRIYVDSTSKTLCIKDDAGVVKHGVQTKAAVASNFLTAVSDAGVFTAAQPDFTDITGVASSAQVPWETPGTIGSTTPNTGSFTTVTVSTTSTVTSGTPIAVQSTITANPSGASSAQYLALQFRPGTQSGNAQNLTATGAGGICGGSVTSTHSGTGTLTRGVGYNATMNTGASGGPITDYMGYRAIVNNSSGSIIGSAYGYRVETFTNTGAGSITTLYGLKVENQTAGGTNYAIFTGTGLVKLNDTTDATSTSSASAFVCAGGGVFSKNLYGAKAILSASPTSGIGYATGAGGTISQSTNKSTGVTLNTVTGTITMNAANLAADTSVSFTLTNSAIAATDAVIVVHESAGTLGAYGFASTAAGGSASITVHNNTPGALAEAIVLRFVVFKSVNA